MIELYTWQTPNGRKISIMLEECGLRYNVHPVNLGKGEQHTPEFTALNPNNKIPVIIDSDGPDGLPITLMESGAILIYLAGKTGRFLPAGTRDKYKALEWLMFQMGSVGPMFGQLHVYLKLTDPPPIRWNATRGSDIVCTACSIPGLARLSTSPANIR